MLTSVIQSQIQTVAHFQVKVNLSLADILLVMSRIHSNSMNTLNFPVKSTVNSEKSFILEYSE